MDWNFVLFILMLSAICGSAFWILSLAMASEQRKKEAAKALREKRTRNLKPLPSSFRLRPKSEQVDRLPEPRK